MLATTKTVLASGATPRRRATRLLTALPALALIATAAWAQSVSVRYRSAESVYLDAGSAAGLTEGEQVEVVRNGERIALLEVVFVAEHSASTRVLEERLDVVPGDTVRRLAGAQPPPAPGTEPAPEAAPDVAAVPVATGPSLLGLERRSHLGGVVTVDWEGVRPAGDQVAASDRTTLRLSLRGRDLGGLPLQLRVRGRVREESRERSLLGGTVPESENRDRIDELSLAWAPDEGRWAARVGRFGVGPLAGIAPLDGAMAEARLPWVALGGFYGRRPDLDDLVGGEDWTRYGAFARFSPPPASTAPPFTVLLAAAREEADGDGASGERDLVSLETHVDRERWSFYQYAEVIVDSGAAAVGSDGSRLTTAALATTLRTSDRGRLRLSYDRLDLERDDFEPVTPEEQFAERLRQGVRLTYDHRGAGGWTAWGSVGLRQAEESGPGESEDATSFSLGWRHGRLPNRFFAGVTLMGFTGPLRDGALASVSAGRRFAAGHEVEMAVGGLGQRDDFDDESVSGWVRLSGWLELPASLFARLEGELAEGDDVDGTTFRAGLGYRF